MLKACSCPGSWKVVIWTKVASSLISHQSTMHQSIIKGLLMQKTLVHLGNRNMFDPNAMLRDKEASLVSHLNLGLPCSHLKL